MAAKLTPEELKARRAATKKAWYEANKGAIKERKAATDKAWAEANKERLAAARKAWAKANKERMMESDKRYRSKLAIAKEFDHVMQQMVDEEAST